jgi:hypothetical protein
MVPPAFPMFDTAGRAQAIGKMNRLIATEHN